MLAVVATSYEQEAGSGGDEDDYEEEDEDVSANHPTSFIRINELNLSQWIAILAPNSGSYMTSISHTMIAWLLETTSFIRI